MELNVQDTVKYRLEGLVSFRPKSQTRAIKSISQVLNDLKVGFVYISGIGVIPIFMKSVLLDTFL